jgi:hypothetical protein
MVLIQRGLGAEAQATLGLPTDSVEKEAPTVDWRICMKITPAVPP